MAAIDPGTLLAGRFEILRPLGAGALAEVFAARDTATGEEVAVKVLHAHAAEDPELADRFRRELGLTRRLDHPGIVRVFELYEHRDEQGARPFISMELLRGETLAERLERFPVPSDDARRILREALEAAQAAHAQGVVHRDLKPQNLFLLEDGRVKLLDFGMARAAGSARHTAASTVLGTPGYLAPEILEGTGGDIRSDLYSLGAVYFELLTGKRAFPALEPFAVLRQQREGAPDVHKAAPGVAVIDAAVLSRALTPDPEQRFQGAEQMLRALGGGKVADAPAPLPAVTPGPLEVRFAQLEMPPAQGPWWSWRGLLRKLVWRELAQRFGLEHPLSRALLAGNTLARGVDERSAEALLQLLQEHGMAGAIVPVQEPRAFGAWLRRNLLAVSGTLSTVAIAAVQLQFSQDPVLTRNPLGWALAAALVSLEMVAVWGLLLPVGLLRLLRASEPFLPAALAGDPALVRLVTGVGRRAKALQQKLGRLPKASRLAADPLLAAAEEAELLCGQVAVRVAALSESTDAEAEAARDRLVERLLVIGAALDEALVGSEQHEAAATRVDSALERLRGETAFALGPVNGTAPAGGPGPTGNTPTPVAVRVR